MATLAPKIEEQSRTMLIRYETEAPISAAAFGDLLKELGKAFDRLARQRKFRGLRLILVDAGIGSHWLHLAVVGAGTAGTATFAFRKEIYDFIDFVKTAVDLDKGLRKGKASATDKKLVNAINAPVASGQAMQVNLIVSGDAASITINLPPADLLWQAPEPEPRRPLAVGAAAPRQEYNALFEESLYLPRLDGHPGTIFAVRGQWYVRLEGEGGVLNPVILSPGVEVVEGGVYRFDGIWEGRSYAIRSARPLSG